MFTCAKNHEFENNVSLKKNQVFFRIQKSEYKICEIKNLKIKKQKIDENQKSGEKNRTQKTRGSVKIFPQIGMYQ